MCKQSVIEKFEQNNPDSFGVAQRDCFFQDADACIGLLLSRLIKIFLVLSVGKQLRYNELLSRIETENKYFVKYSLSLCANGMVYHIRVDASVHNIPGLSH